MNQIFENMLSHYEIRTKEDYTNALHEIMQQITLAGLYKAGFFEKAAFYGGITTSFSPNLNNKTTSVANRLTYNSQPHYLIKI